MGMFRRYRFGRKAGAPQRQEAGACVRHSGTDDASSLRARTQATTPAQAVTVANARLPKKYNTAEHKERLDAILAAVGRAADGMCVCHRPPRYC